MTNKKYINTKDVVDLTGRPYDEILNLVKTGVLLGHKTRRGHWRFNVDAVEKYFGVQINVPTEEEEDDKQMSKTKTSEVNKQESNGKLICGHTARKYLNCNKAEFKVLVDQGVIQAYRDENNRWKVSKESVLNYAKQSQITNGTRLIINENHYLEVIQRICSAKSSIKIMTANFRRFNLKPTDSQGDHYKDGTPFIKYLMAKAVQGVSVQIICSEPSSTFSEEWKEYYRQMMNPKLFEYKYCDRNHAKVVIIDDKLAYVGSANVTPAGLGQGIFTPGNFEAGLITENPDLVSSVNTLFSSIWDNNYCKRCHRADKCSEKNS